MSATYEPGQSYNYQLLIKHILEMPLVFAPNQEIVYRDKLRLTYRQLNERIHRLAGGLEKLGVKKGDVVCVFDYDSNRYLECFFAVPMMGAVLHTQNWRLSPDQVLYTMNHAEDKIVIIHTDFLPLLEAVWDQIKTVKTVILISEDGSRPASKIPFAAEYEEVLTGAAPSYDFPEFDENTRATTFYTTGTTGLPKGVSFSHRQLVLHAQALMIMTGSYEGIGRMRSTDVYMPMTPMFHVHAWGVPYAATMIGVKQVYPGRYEPEMLLKLILMEKVTFSHCVPTIIQMLVSNPFVKQLDLSHWKVVIGGAALSKGLALAAMELGIQIYAAYGMSETCPLLTLCNVKPWMLDLPKEKLVDYYTKTGIPAPLVYVRVRDARGNELPHDGKSAGEVVVRAPWLTEGYHKDPERTRELWRDGWLHTGDVANIDEEGYLQITDRIKDVIKTGGEWISSLELENLLSQHEAVMEAAAIGVPDSKWGERPFMVAVLKADFQGKVTSDDLKKYLMEMSETGRIPKYGVPDRVEIVEAIPKTSVGKINKVALRKTYGA
ncbi:MAG: long-chain fatty acid--CoA ligase [Deltaproteobacteria bacterium HGW-Deltaproteobacteria-19]|jgi:fatty-acyl-CoA synthase|nr:MAG: long-chain fatty acid--CoA ligase [Deltaproteobacteria bacterium HGW-Deltaproteobacteria-19]